VSDSSPLTASGAEVTAFIESSGMTKVELERLLGISESSKGKTLRRWELYGAPPMGTLLMAYLAEHGFDLARDILEADGVDLLVVKPAKGD
jgi:hypothetical protein